MGKEDWSNFDRPEPFCDKVWGGSRSRSSSPKPSRRSRRHLEVVKIRDFGYDSLNRNEYLYYVPMFGSRYYITEEQVQEINKMKLKQDAEMKKLLREVDDDYVLQSDEEWATEEDIKKVEEEFADALDDFIKSIVRV